MYNFEDNGLPLNGPFYTVTFSPDWECEENPYKQKIDKIKEVVKDYEDFILSLEGKRGIDLWDEDLGYVTHFEKAVEGIVKIQDILEDKD
jgi:hypothetical protein